MNYYHILGTTKHATTREIKQHYYQLSKKYHPDKNHGQSDEKFKSLSEAYSTLSNPKKRYIYDMKLLLRDNLGEDIVYHFSDLELEILNNYYLKITSTTEFKFLKLLYASLPINLKRKINKYQKTLTKHELVDLRDIKYIEASTLYENYEVNLNRSLKDVYLNRCKEIIVVTQHKVYHLFITHSDYSMKIYLGNSFFITINIITILPDKYTLNGNDVYYNHRINLYEYYFEELFPITLPNDFCINLRNTEEFNNSVRIPRFGLKSNLNMRGDLYIYKNLDLSVTNKNHYREILKEIFT